MSLPHRIAQVDGLVIGRVAGAATDSGADQSAGNGADTAEDGADRSTRAGADGSAASRAITRLRIRPAGRHGKSTSQQRNGDKTFHSGDSSKFLIVRERNAVQAGAPRPRGPAISQMIRPTT